MDNNEVVVAEEVSHKTSFSLTGRKNILKSFCKDFCYQILSFLSLYHKNAVFTRVYTCYAFDFISVISLFQQPKF